MLRLLTLGAPAMLLLSAVDSPSADRFMSASTIVDTYGSSVHAEADAKSASEQTRTCGLPRGGVQCLDAPAEHPRCGMPPSEDCFLSGGVGGLSSISFSCTTCQ